MTMYVYVTKIKKTKTPKNATFFFKTNKRKRDYNDTTTYNILYFFKVSFIAYEICKVFLFHVDLDTKYLAKYSKRKKIQTFLVYNCKLWCKNCNIRVKRYNVYIQYMYNKGVINRLHSIVYLSTFL